MIVLKNVKVGYYNMKKQKKTDREKIPASVLLTSIITAVVILAICAVVFFISFNNVVSAGIF
mgnify:CR=1 FL=1